MEQKQRITGADLSPSWKLVIRIYETWAAAIKDIVEEIRWYEGESETSQALGEIYAGLVRDRENAWKMAAREAMERKEGDGDVPF